MPGWLLQRVVGTDNLTMWRWLRTAGLEFDLAPTREILPTARTVTTWLTQRQPAASDRG
jgi:hypothetical protein